MLSLIFSKTAAEHKKHVEIVLSELRKHKLTAPNPFVMLLQFVPTLGCVPNSLTDLCLSSEVPESGVHFIYLL